MESGRNHGRYSGRFPNSLVANYSLIRRGMGPQETWGHSQVTRRLLSEWYHKPTRWCPHERASAHDGCGLMAGGSRRVINSGGYKYNNET